MKKNRKIDKLAEEFPNLYRKAPADTEHALHAFQKWSFDGSMIGWYDLLHELSTNLEPLFIADESLYVHQVKEKFGGLRFYISHYPKDLIIREKVSSFINDAQEKSLKTCDICGKPGTLGSPERYYVSTRCVEHINADWRDYENK